MQESRTPLLIGFSGEIASGKDTAAEFLIEESESVIPPVQFAFADGLKNIVGETFGIDRETSDLIKRNKNIKPFNGKSLREVYQHFGETIKSHFGESVWVDLTMSRLLDAKNATNSELYICTDVRYSYESAALRKFAEDHGMNCLIIKMVNLNHSPKSNDKSKTPRHISEIQTGINPDSIIKAYSVEEIKEQLFTILKEKEYYV